MPMKTVADIPEDVVVMLRISSKGTFEFAFVDTTGTHRLEDLGSLEVDPPAKIDSSPYHLYKADNIEAGHGWGPFLMDVAMEWVTARLGLLYPHPTGIVPDAVVMWTKYLNERDDVDKTPMSAANINELGITHQQAELRHFYEKDPVTLVALVRARKWLAVIG